MHRQADDGGRQPAFADGRGDGEAVHAGHVDVEDGDLRMQLFDRRERRFAIAGVADDREVGLALDELAQARGGRSDDRRR